MPVPRPIAGAVGEVVRERPGGQDERNDERERGDARGHRAQPAPAGTQGERDGTADKCRNPAAAASRQRQRGQEQGDGGESDGTEASVEEERDSRREPDRREPAEGVRIAHRLVEQRALERVGRARRPVEETLPERVRTDDADAGKRAGEERAADGERRGEHGDVQERTLRLEQGRVAVGRPERGKRRPARERGQREHGDELEPGRDDWPMQECEPGGRQQRDRPGPPDVRVVVATLAEGEQHDETAREHRSCPPVRRPDHGAL